MAEVLRLQSDELAKLGADLARIRSAFFAADVFTDAAAEAAGHPVLRDCLHTFSASWDDRRSEIVEGVQFLANAVRGIEAAFEQVDGELADGLASGAGQ